MARKRRTINTSQRLNRALARPLSGGLVALSNHRPLATAPDGVGLLAAWPTTPNTFATEIIHAEPA